MQWFALALLAVGVGLVQVDHLTLENSKHLVKHSASHQDDNESQSTPESEQQQNYFIGLIAVIIVCFTSAFAGIYFEKILKSSPQISIWMQNIRLSIFGAPISLLISWVKDSESITEKGYFNSYDSVVWVIVLGGAIGGLMVSLCIRFADNILKGYSQSCAVIFSCVASVFLFHFRPTSLFLLGTTMVSASIYFYSRFPSSSEALAKLPEYYRNKAAV